MNTDQDFDEESDDEIWDVTGRFRSSRADFCLDNLRKDEHDSALFTANINKEEEFSHELTVMDGLNIINPPDVTETSLEIDNDDNALSGNAMGKFRNYYNGSFYSPIRNKATNPFLNSSTRDDISSNKNFEIEHQASYQKFFSNPFQSENIKT